MAVTKAVDHYLKAMRFMSHVMQVISFDLPHVHSLCENRKSLYSRVRNRGTPPNVTNMCMC